MTKEKLESDLKAQTFEVNVLKGRIHTLSLQCEELQAQAAQKEEELKSLATKQRHAEAELSVKEQQIRVLNKHVP